MSAEDLGRTIATELANEGFPRVPAQILLRLMTEPSGAMTAAGLADALGLSAAAVSGGVKYLGVLGFLRVDVVPGTRRHVYALPVLPWYASTLTQDRYAPLLAMLEIGLPSIDAGPARDRLEEMAAFFRFLQAEMPRLWTRWQEEQRHRSP